MAAAVVLGGSWWSGTKIVRIGAAITLAILLASAIRPTLRMIADPIDWSAKTYEQYPGDVMGNADLCEPSDKQLAIDRRNSGSTEALWHLVNHYTVCDMKPAEMYFWLRKLADKNDTRAIVLLSDYSEIDGRHQEAVEWARRAASLGYDAKAEREKEMRMLSR